MDRDLYELGLPSQTSPEKQPRTLSCRNSAAECLDDFDWATFERQAYLESSPILYSHTTLPRTKKYIIGVYKPVFLIHLQLVIAFSLFSGLLVCP
jgi:hypothetical protein